MMPAAADDDSDLVRRSSRVRFVACVRRLRSSNVDITDITNLNILQRTNYALFDKIHLCRIRPPHHRLHICPGTPPARSRLPRTLWFLCQTALSMSASSSTLTHVSEESQRTGSPLVSPSRSHSAHACSRAKFEIRQPTAGRMPQRWEDTHSVFAGQTLTTYRINSGRSYREQQVCDGLHPCRTMTPRRCINPRRA